MKLTKEQCRDILAKQVGDQLAYEMSKPFRKINWEIVTMCEHVFEIIYPEYMLTDERDRRTNTSNQGRSEVCTEEITDQHINQRRMKVSPVRCSPLHKTRDNFQWIHENLRTVLLWMFLRKRSMHEFL